MKSVSKPVAGAHSEPMEVVGVSVHGGKIVTRVKGMFVGNFSVSTKNRQKNVFSCGKPWISCSDLKLI